MTRIPVTHSPTLVADKQTPWHWLTQGWHALRDRAMDSLTYFAPHDPDGSEISPVSKTDEHAREQRWGIVAIDLTNGANQVEVDLEIPGMEKSDLAIDIENDYLVVSGQKFSSSQRQEKDVLVTERAFGKFQRRLPLPCRVDMDEATAVYKNGVLKVRLPKLDVNRRTVTVSAH